MLSASGLNQPAPYERVPKLTNGCIASQNEPKDAHSSGTLVVPAPPMPPILRRLIAEVKSEQDATDKGDGRAVGKAEEPSLQESAKSDEPKVKSPPPMPEMVAQALAAYRQANASMAAPTNSDVVEAALGQQFDQRRAEVVSSQSAYGDVPDQTRASPAPAMPFAVAEMIEAVRSRREAQSELHDESSTNSILSVAYLSDLQGIASASTTAVEHIVPRSEAPAATVAFSTAAMPLAIDAPSLPPFLRKTNDQDSSHAESMDRVPTVPRDIDWDGSEELAELQKKISALTSELLVR